MHAPSKKSSPVSHAPQPATSGNSKIRSTTPPESVPRPAPVPREALASGYIGPPVDAPPWALAVIEELQQTRSELSAVMGEFTDAAAALERQNREVIANQAALRRAFDHLRSEFRSRVGAHDGEFDEVRARLETLEQELSALNALLDSRAQK